MMKWIDLPPVWLLGFLALVYAQSALWPVLAHLPTQPFGIAMIGTGLALMLAALWQMVRGGTTFIPREEPAAFIDGGVFMLSRNPIYLGDAFVLGGAALYWGAIPSLVLVPVFMWLISWRFIEGEEEMLKRFFGHEYEAYMKETRRWL